MSNYLTVVSRAPYFTGSVVSAALFLSLVVSAAGQKTLRASDAWVAEPVSGRTSTALFMSVENPTMYDVYLVGGETDAAARVEFREVSGGTVKPVKEISISAYGSIELKAGAAFVELVDLKRPLKAGDRVAVTLRTDGGDVIVADATVRTP